MQHFYRFILLCLFILGYTHLGHAKITPLDHKMCENLVSLGKITPENPVPCERLNVITFDYINFSGEKKVGIMIVLDVFAPQTEKLFAELYKVKFPIERVRTLKEFNDLTVFSSQSNNTTAFNGRKIVNSGSWSKHAYGAAIDINPRQNPYISFEPSGTTYVIPEDASEQYFNRRDIRPNKPMRTGMVEDVIDIFLSHGFMRWGGFWDNPIDYQHFEVGSFGFINELLEKPLTEARAQFKQYGDNYKMCLESSTKPSIDAKRAECVEKYLQ